jgi:predicted PurR-regulated permease PerM
MKENAQPSSGISVSSPAVPPATVYEKAAWILMAVGLVVILKFHLLSGLLAGLFMFALIKGLAEKMHGKRLNHERAKVVALGSIVAVLILAVTALVLLLIAVLKGHFLHVPKLLEQLAASLDKGRDWIRDLGFGDVAPGVESEQLPNLLARKVREHGEYLKHAGGEMGLMIVHAIVGIVIGALVAFEHREPGGPFAIALQERVRRLEVAFHAVVFAQIKISAVNTVLTGIFLWIGLPAFGIHMPLRHTIIVLTFLFGLLPVVGNLVSNTIIVLVAAGVSPVAGVAALCFLIIIHKLEYFLNARIMGEQIHAAAWEILIVIFTFEAIFGIPGVILAPIAYAYAKTELTDRKLI